MPELSTASLRLLATCHADMQAICHDAIKIYDFTILCGHRGRVLQDKLFASGASKLKYPNSKHNSNPSLAIDIAPYPIDWQDTTRFYYLAGIIKCLAHGNNISLRWGGDWDCDSDFADQSFNDLVHFELV